MGVGDLELRDELAFDLLKNVGIDFSFDLLAHALHLSLELIGRLLVIDLNAPVDSSRKDQLIAFSRDLGLLYNAGLRGMHGKSPLWE
jgi:hypothetical protein